jgi:hypothetical protein
MSALAGLLPLVWFAGACGLIILVIRLNRRLSRGSRTAGPRRTPKPDPPGLAATPWELEAIDQQLTSPLGSTARRDLVATVNRLIAASRDRAELAPLPLSASNRDIEQVVSILETKLDVSTEHDSPTGDSAVEPRR